MENDFDSWNELKKAIEINTSEPDRFPQVGEVWMSILGRNIGFEQNGSGNNFSRPILVVKKFNNQMFWCVPLSTKQKGFNFYYNFTDPEGKKVSVILAQLKLVSIKRFKRKIYDLSLEDLKKIKQNLKRFLD